MRRSRWFAFLLISTLLLAAACQPAPVPAEAPAASTTGLPRVLATESFLADIAQNVAGDRLQVATLIPLGLDPHAFEPTPQDVVRIADADILIVNGAGFEAWLQEVLDNAGGERLVVEASAGLETRPMDEVHAGEAHADEAHADEAHADEAHADEAHADEAHADEAHADEAHAGEAHADETDSHEDHADEHHHEGGDPHFWFDPTNVAVYTANIRDGLSALDPDGAAIYAANAEAYTAQLDELDGWIQAQVAQIPAERRLLVTNHESLGYFADRYGFRVVGTVIPSFSTGAAPSAQQLAELTDHIKEAGVPVIFLETGANAQLAEQLAQETDIQVVTELYSHSLSAPDGPAPTYIDMMRYNTEAIVAALQGAQ
jgi:ABC-type Zn uptake system ZnuABC Zn-binding protein ZnuA